jgi:hypothetical protein
MKPVGHPMWMAMVFPIVCAGALVHALGRRNADVLPVQQCSV